MIQHVTHVFTDLATLGAALSTGTIAQKAADSQAQLIQIYTAQADQPQILTITRMISDRLPTAIIIGATTVGEVAHGQLMTNQVIIGFTFFVSSRINLLALACSNGEERNAGAELGLRINDCAPDIAGVLLLSTPLSLDAAALLQGLESTLNGYPVFGGGAGDYAEISNSLLFAGNEHITQGAIAVVLSGPDLHIESKTYLGWQPLSRSMRITQVDGLHVQRIDGLPAFDVYRRYLNIADDEQFFLNALEFPFLLEREGELLARVPVASCNDGVLRFVADIQEGETFRLGYGDIELIAENAKVLHQSMKQFAPQAIFLYTCGCRRFLMQEDVELETLPFEQTAPTFGFYTYGEFFGSSKLTLLNSTMVAVGLREGEKQAQNKTEHTSKLAPRTDDRDPYANKHTRVVSRLLRFIDAVTSELEEAIEEVTKLSITDRLTQLVNRIRLDQVIDEQIALAKRYATPFAVILLDVDHFKLVNDTHGHLVGDAVLVQVAQVLVANTRAMEVVGRWGGEEFLVIVPNTNLADATQLAEKLRRALENTLHPVVGYKTGSFGVAAYASGDTPGELVARADAALYRAKHAGRNRVEAAPIS